MRLVLVIAVVLMVWIPGCMQPPSSDAEEGEVPAPEAPDISDVLVYMRAPRNFENEYEFQVSILSPDGTRQAGHIRTDPTIMTADMQDYLNESYPGKERLDEELPSAVSGDFHETEPYTNSTYPYARFEEVSYRGNWTIEFEWEYGGPYGEQVTGVDPQDRRDCIAFGFGAPNGALRVFDGDPHYESDCYVAGTLTYTYEYNATEECFEHKFVYEPPADEPDMEGADGFEDMTCQDRRDNPPPE